MSKNTSIILGEHFDKFIQSQVKKGRYGSASEVIRNGLRLLEIENEKIKAINKALVIGDESGPPEKFDNEEFTKRMLEKYGW